MPKTNRDSALKHPTHQPLNPDRSATTEALVPVMLRSTVVAVDIKARMLSEEAPRNDTSFHLLLEALRSSLLFLAEWLHVRAGQQ